MNDTIIIKCSEWQVEWLSPMKRKLPNLGPSVNFRIALETCKKPSKKVYEVCKYQILSSMQNLSQVQ